MSTIDNFNIIQQIINNNGYYETDPRVAFIVEYKNMGGHTTWGVTWSNEAESRQRRYMIESVYIRNPKVIWRAE